MNKINCLQIASMIIMVVLSSFFGISIFSILRVGGVDAYLSPVIGGVIGFFFLLLFLYIADYEPDLALPDKIDKLVGKKWGFLLNAILVAIFFTMAVSGMFNLMNFIVSQFLSETPLFIIGLVFTILIIYLNGKGLETLSRIGLLLLMINLILFVIVLLGLIPEVDFANFKPFLEFGLTKPMQSAFYIITLNVTPIYLLLIIPKNMAVNQKQYHKYIIGFYIISFVLAFFVIATTIGNLGIQLASIYQYPEYMVLKHISFFDFLDRIENIATIQWIFGLFFSLSLVVYYITNTVRRHNKTKWVPTIVAFSILFVAAFSFRNNTIFNQYSFHYAPYIRLGVIGVLVIVGSVIFIRKHVKTKD